MSSKVAKRQNAKPALTPKLRFPEFRDEDGWEESGLADISSAIFDGTHQTPTYTAEGIPFYSVENLVSGNANKFISKEDHELATKKNKPEQGDVLITRIGKIGYSQVVSWPHEFSIYVTLAVIKRGPKFNSHFLHYSIQSALYQKEILSKSLLNAVPCKINMDSLRLTRICLAGPAEQQKIAECLTTLDEVIAAQSQKLDALKTHKKGLMQQLFPREGETLPRLRFPEFQAAPEWEEKKLENLAKRASGHTPSKSHPEYYNGGIKWVSLADSRRLDNGLISETENEISQQGIKNSSAVLHPAGTVLISRDAGVGKSAVMNSPMAVSQHFIVWRCDSSQLSNWFLYYLLQKLKPLFERVAVGSTIKTIGLPFFKDLSVTVPSPAEQQRIAACLTSLDDLITALTQKIEALKTHKKGLMQQLFPSPETNER